MSAAICAHQRENGRGCGGYAITDSSFCYAHTPGLENERTEARRRGGQVGKPAALPACTPDVPVRTHDDIVALLEMTINDVRAGRIDPRVANSIGTLASIGRVVIDQANLAVQVQAIEAVLSPTRREAVEQRRRAAAHRRARP